MRVTPEMFYFEYRIWMTRRYGPGPWRPGHVDPSDRWSVWVAKKMEVYA